MGFRDLDWSFQAGVGPQGLLVAAARHISWTGFPALWACALRKASAYRDSMHLHVRTCSRMSHAVLCNFLLMTTLGVLGHLHLAALLEVLVPKSTYALG